MVERDVGDGGTEGQVGSDEVQRVGGREVSRAEVGVRCGVESAIREESSLVVLRTIRSL